MDRANPNLALPNTAAQFAQSLKLSIQLMGDLEAAMLEETRAIETRESDSLLRVLASKRDLVARLEEETLLQKQWVALAHHPFTPVGMTKFFAGVGDDGQLLGLWSILRESSTRCDGMNRSNARLIERGRKRVATSLRILIGDDGTSATYNPRGRTESTTPRSRTFSQA
ncbi:FlgN protein [Thiocystis violascens DSM 198]|uniref:FlgN protein n=2 Tax=Thiocystis violascens TaxID=73141 RepID=I3Y640_THIV6|nr:FlgN protein [Thiocystis violascens DSM 198]